MSSTAIYATAISVFACVALHLVILLALTSYQDRQHAKHLERRHR